MGVPNRAERLPPIWRAAPSRPALPPVRWVSTEPRKISGARRTGGRVSPRTLAMIWLVPLSFSMPAAR